MKGGKLFEYEVGRKLGEGSFGEVLLGTKGGERFAIKKISKKQVIKVLSTQSRSTSCMSPSSRRKSSTASISSAKTCPTLSKYTTPSPTKITSISFSNIALEELLNSLP